MFYTPLAWLVCVLVCWAALAVHACSMSRALSRCSMRFWWCCVRLKLSGRAGYRTAHPRQHSTARHSTACLSCDSQHQCITAGMGHIACCRFIAVTAQDANMPGSLASSERMRVVHTQTTSKHPDMPTSHFVLAASAPAASLLHPCSSPAPSIPSPTASRSPHTPSHPCPCP